MTEGINDSSDILVKISLTPNEARLNSLREFFIEEFQTIPCYFVRVPGRVNLIGEHIDYCGYPVLPMAIEQSILLAVAPSTDDILQLKNIDSEKYKAYKCSLNSLRIDVPEKGGPQWHNYFLCGVKGILDYIPYDTNRQGMMIAVSGNIPAASGLSSSSALVSASTLATSYIYGMELNKNTLATISANCERYIGTQGGGMDQAIAFLAQQGCAQYIEWNPLTATPVLLPKDVFFVIANSLAEANKAATSDFNERVIECRLGCRLLASKLGLSWRDIDRFSNLQKALNCSLEEIESIADSQLIKSSYTRNDILTEFNISENEFEDKLLTPNTKHLMEFKLRQRALHVFQESLRVEKFKLAAHHGNTIQLANLMRQSHFSLNTLYECSHESLNKLIEISDRSGVAARLTGAGWGGCIVALCDSAASCDAYIESLKASFYNDLPQIKGRNFNEIVFSTSPQRGAEIYVDVI